jgi:rhodanese-related sulfurtransferase
MQGAISGSRLVSMFALLKGELPLPVDKPILLVCAVGGRSYAAAQVLSRRGYREVYNLSGGVNAWYKAGLPLVYGRAALAE